MEVEEPTSEKPKKKDDDQSEVRNEGDLRSDERRPQGP